MRAVFCLGMFLMSGPLAAMEVNDNGTTGEYRVHQGFLDAVPGGEVEFDPSDSSTASLWPNTGWVSAFGFEMRGRNSPFDFATSTSAGSMWCQPGSTELFSDVRLHVPHNARITFFRMWGYDNSSAQDLQAFLFESCLPSLGAGSPVNTLLGQLASSGTPGDFTVTTGLASPQPVTNTHACTYWARARFGNECIGGSLIARKFRIQYTLE